MCCCLSSCSGIFFEVTSIVPELCLVLTPTPTHPTSAWLLAKHTHIGFYFFHIGPLFVWYFSIISSHCLLVMWYNFYIYPLPLANFFLENLIHWLGRHFSSIPVTLPCPFWGCLCSREYLLTSIRTVNITPTKLWHMMTSSNGNIFRVTGPLCGEFTGHRWIPRTKASDAELWYFLWSAPE